MIPMRDGVKLYTVIMIPRNAHNAPILLTRSRGNRRPGATRMLGRARQIRLEGDYVMTRPPRGPLNPTRIDHSTDA